VTQLKAKRHAKAKAKSEAAEAKAAVEELSKSALKGVWKKLMKMARRLAAASGLPAMAEAVIGYG